MPSNLDEQFQTLHEIARAAVSRAWSDQHPGEERGDQAWD